MSHNNKNFNSVFYAKTYHPVQAGSIDGTDIRPHDNAVYRALLCSNTGLYDPFGDPYCTIFVGRLSHFTTEETLRQVMSKYERVKNLRLVRHIVTGASHGNAFVEFETENEMQRAYMDAHHTFIDDSELIVDYNRQQLMPGWIPLRLGRGLGGKKESGQLRFGGRERPFQAPLSQADPRREGKSWTQRKEGGRVIRTKTSTLYSMQKHTIQFKLEVLLELTFILMIMLFIELSFALILASVISFENIPFLIFNVAVM